MFQELHYTVDSGAQRPGIQDNIMPNIQICYKIIKFDLFDEIKSRW